LRQLENLAQKTMTPFGYFFLATPPVEALPIPDFRTVGDRPIGRPSPNLVETIQTMQRRQAWMREFVVENGQPRLDFVGSANSGGRTMMRFSKMMSMPFLESHFGHRRTKRADLPSIGSYWTKSTRAEPK
jgi:hypothetical protein